VAAVAAAVLATVGLTRTAVRRLGGITGDVLGWLVELALLGTLVVLATP
jgi:adenosylcobinamide-GDP ribazoletransferase